MRRRFYLGLGFCAVSLSACAATPKLVSSSNSDFSIDGAVEQRINVGKAKQLVIRCWCKKHTSTIAAGNDVVLRIKANYSSVGYHGDQTPPKQIEPGRMRFVEKQQDGALLLESREIIYMHHAFFVTELEVEVPQGVELRWDILDGKALDFRDVAPLD